MTSTAEGKRLSDARSGGWRQWGPYLSERQWGTVREDYSDNGDAWNYFTHDQARSRAYRWGEDGLAGVSDDRGLMCLALALWNGQDPILKERLFGLTNSEGNHGEDVKEYYFYVDNTPDPLVDALALQVPAGGLPVRRPGRAPTGTAASATRSTSCSTPASSTTAATSTSRSTTPRPAPTTCWPGSRCATAAPRRRRSTCCRRCGSATPGRGASSPPSRRCGPSTARGPCVAAHHDVVGDYWLHVRDDADLLFCENETNTERLWGQPNASPYVKDGVDQAVVHGERDAVELRERHQGRRALAGGRPGRRRRWCSTLRLTATRARRRRPVRGLRRRAALRAGRGRRVLRLDHPGVARRRPGAW